MALDGTKGENRRGRCMSGSWKTDRRQTDRHTEDRAADGKQVEDRSTDIETDRQTDRVKK